MLCPALKQGHARVIDVTISLEGGRGRETVDLLLSFRAASSKWCIFFNCKAVLKAPNVFSPQYFSELLSAMWVCFFMGKLTSPTTPSWLLSSSVNVRCAMCDVRQQNYIKLPFKWFQHNLRSTKLNSLLANNVFQKAFSGVRQLIRYFDEILIFFFKFNHYHPLRWYFCRQRIKGAVRNLERSRTCLRKSVASRPSNFTMTQVCPRYDSSLVTIDLVI